MWEEPVLSNVFVEEFLMHGQLDNVIGVYKAVNEKSPGDSFCCCLDQSSP
jgi:hypothetical protein